jgi:hypothetical protein
VLEIFYFTGTCITLIAGIAYYYERWERFAKEEERGIYRRWLRQPSLGKGIMPSWPRAFLILFDRIFGKRHFSWKCIRNSFLTSLIFVTFIFLLKLIIFNLDIEGTFRNKSVRAIAAFFILPIFPNFIVDYIALMKSRFVIHKLSKYYPKGTILNVLIIPIDLFINFMISSLAFVVLFYIADFFVGGSGSVHNFLIYDDHDPKNIVILGQGKIQIHRGLLETYLDVVANQDALGTFFYATFFTSLWIWLFALSGFVIRQLRRIDEWMKHINLRRLVDEKAMSKEPIACYGYIVAWKIGFPLLIIVDLIWIPLVLLRSRASIP